MLKKFLKETPQAASIVVGLACAGIVLEALRTPAVRNVTFEVFHPLPYLVEGAALLLMALAMTRAPRDLRLEDHPLAAIAACVAASGSLILIVQSEALVGDFAKDVVAATYRLSSALLFILWAERLFRLGARRAACAYALSLVAGAALLAALSFCPLAIGKAALATLPVLSMGLLLSLRGKHEADQQERIDGVEESPLDESLPALKPKANAMPPSPPRCCSSPSSCAGPSFRCNRRGSTSKTARSLRSCCR